MLCSTVNSRSKKNREKKPVLSCASSGHITTLKQSIFGLSISMEHTANTHSVLAGSAKVNGREPKTCLGRVFDYKLGCFDDVFVFIYVDALPYL